MTVLTVLQDVAPEIGIEVPDVVFGGTERNQVELRTHLNRAAIMIMRDHEWQLLHTVATFTGDDAATAFALPTGYDRMPQKAQMWSSSLEAPMTHIMSSDRWLDLDVRSYDFVNQAWILIGDQFEIKPVMATGITGKIYYIDGRVFTANGGGSTIARAVNDGDIFRLDDEVLKLAVIWRWKKAKGRPYAEDMADYNEELNKRIKEDKGSRMIIVGRRRIPKGARTAYPQTITG